MPVAHWLQLSMTDGLGPTLIHRLVAAAGSAQNACAATAAELGQIQGIGPAKASAIAKSLVTAADAAAEESAKAASLGVAMLCPEDQSYPALLRHIPDPPPVLYVKGALADRDLNALAIVGSRKCSYYGREQADRLAAALAGAGLTIVSGGARGIDSAAHRGALSHPQGRTLAVLGSGLDRPYPEENIALFDQIAARGAILSEFSLGTAPLAENFPRRNRIISGLSRGVLVIEAAQRSGALITARHANEDHGRPVFAVPGKIDNPLSAGTHELIRDGAVLVMSMTDILDNLGPLPADISLPAAASVPSPGTPPTPSPGTPGEGRGEGFPGTPDLTPSQQTILACMNHDDMTVDRLIEQSKLPASQVLQDLTLLSLKGLVRRIEGQKYVRRRPSHGRPA